MRVQIICKVGNTNRIPKNRGPSKIPCISGDSDRCCGRGPQAARRKAEEAPEDNKRVGKSAYLHQERAPIHYWSASACMLRGTTWQVFSQKNDRPVQVGQGNGQAYKAE